MLKMFSRSSLFCFVLLSVLALMTSAVYSEEYCQYVEVSGSEHHPTSNAIYTLHPEFHCNSHPVWVDPSASHYIYYLMDGYDGWMIGATSCYQWGNFMMKARSDLDRPYDVEPALWQEFNPLEATWARASSLRLRCSDTGPVGGAVEPSPFVPVHPDLDNTDGEGETEEEEKDIEGEGKDRPAGGLGGLACRSDVRWCENGAKCLPRAASAAGYVCVCKRGYTGYNCQDTADDTWEMRKVIFVACLSGAALFLLSLISFCTVCVLRRRQITLKSCVGSLQQRMMFKYRPLDDGVATTIA